VTGQPNISSQLSRSPASGERSYTFVLVMNSFWSELIPRSGSRLVTPVPALLIFVSGIPRNG